jgi:hypothetical protein
VRSSLETRNKGTEIHNDETQDSTTRMVVVVRRMREKTGVIGQGEDMKIPTGDLNAMANVTKKGDMKLETDQRMGTNDEDLIVTAVDSNVGWVLAENMNNLGSKMIANKIREMQMMKRLA